LIVVALLGFSGCSLFLVHGPADDARRTGAEPVACTMRSSSPTIDLVLATVLGVAVGAVVQAVASIPGETIGNQSEPPSSRGKAILTGSLAGVVVASPWAISGVIGLRRISDCTEVNSKVAPRP
jgi:hypothetical protein